MHSGVSSWRRIEDNAIPARAEICGAYVDSALASDDRQKAGFDEAVLLDENTRVAEGAAGALQGIARWSMIGLAFYELALRVIERPINRSELYLCDEFFFTGMAVDTAPIGAGHCSVKDETIGRLSHATVEKLYLDATWRISDVLLEMAYPVYQSRMKHEQELVSRARSLPME